MLLLLSAVLFSLGCRESIIHDLSEKQANRLLTQLSTHAINGEKSIQPNGEWEVLVRSADVIPALHLIDSKRLVRAEPSNHQRSSKMIKTREEERFLVERSLSGEIEETLRTLEGVLEARVHLNLPPSDPLLGRPRNGEDGSGSVLLITMAGSTVNKGEIGALVGGASGVPVERISVILFEEHEPNREPPVPVGASNRTLNDDPWRQPRPRDTFLLFLAAALGGGLIIRRITAKRAFLRELRSKYGVE